MGSWDHTYNPENWHVNVVDQIMTQFIGVDKNYVLTPVVMALTMILSYFFLFIINNNAGSEFKLMNQVNLTTARLLNHLELLTKILFCHPPGLKEKKDPQTYCVQLRHFFTDQTKVQVNNF